MSEFEITPLREIQALARAKPFFESQLTNRLKEVDHAVYHAAAVGETTVLLDSQYLKIDAEVAERFNAAGFQTQILWVNSFTWKLGISWKPEAEGF